jgi:biotin carboxyl carrier protein
LKYFAIVNGTEHEVELIERAGELLLSVDGEPLELNYDEVDQLGQLALRVGNYSYGASVEGGPSDYAVTIAGLRYTIELEDERERAANAAAREKLGGGGPVKSVMPGVVVDVLVSEGETVVEGQPLLILEAMKMQNEIGAPSAGVVTGVHVSAGEAISGGAKLVTLTVPEEE